MGARTSSDPEDLVLEAVAEPTGTEDLLWSVNGDQTGSGRFFSPGPAGPGRNSVTVEARRGDGVLLATAETSIEIRDPTADTGPEEPEEDRPDLEPPPTADQIRAEADPEIFDQTFRIDGDNLPIAQQARPAVPTPWQAIPRLAFMVNFNYVYDPEREEWVRQQPFSGGGGGGTALFQTFGTIQTIPGTGALTEVNLNGSDFDTLGGGSTANNEIVVPSDGLYVVLAQVTFANIPDGTEISASVFVGGGLQIQNSTLVGDQGTGSTPANRVLQLSSGDAVSLEVGQNSGSGEFLSGGSDKTYLSVAQL